MLALWINFGTLVNGSLSWLRGRYWLGAFLGAWGGPAAYYSGHRVGALTFHPPLIIHLAVLGIAWAVAVPLLFLSGGKVPGKARTAPRKGSQPDGLSIPAFLPLLISRSKRSLIGNNQYFRTIGWVNWF